MMEVDHILSDKARHLRYRVSGTSIIKHGWLTSSELPSHFGHSGAVSPVFGAGGVVVSTRDEAWSNGTYR